MENAVDCGCFNSGMRLWYLHPGNRVGAGNSYIFSNSPKGHFTGYFISRTEANHLNGLSKFYNSSTLLPKKRNVYETEFTNVLPASIFALFHLDKILLLMPSVAPAQYQTTKMIACGKTISGLGRRQSHCCANSKGSVPFTLPLNSDYISNINQHIL